MNYICSPLTITEAEIPDEGGIVEWIAKHPLEVAMALFASGALGYIVYDKLKKPGYQPTKTSKATKSGKK